MYRLNRSNSFVRTAIPVCACAVVALAGALVGGCQHKMTPEEEQQAVATFKGGPPPANEQEIEAKERARAEEYRKAHPEKFPTNIKR